MRTGLPSSGWSTRRGLLCRTLGASLLVSLIGACGVDAGTPEVDEEEISSQLRDAFGDPEGRRDPDACIEGTVRGRICREERGWRERVEFACRAFGGHLERFAAIDACREGGFRGAAFRCCPAPPPPPPNECVREVVRLDACLPADHWKEVGARTCRAKMLVLKEVKPDHVCGERAFDSAVVVCCRPEPPPPPPPPMCATEVLGDRTSCKPSATWKEYAVRLCESRRLHLRELALSERCGEDQFRLAKVACCPAEPPPPPNRCEPVTQGSTTSCKSEATWKEYAAKDCASRGLHLGELGFAERCGEGHFRFARYACCIR